MPREQTRGSGVLENALLLRCRDGPRNGKIVSLQWTAAGAPLGAAGYLLVISACPRAAVHNSPTRGSGVLENALLLVCAAGDLLVISASVSWDHDSGHVLAILY